MTELAIDLIDPSADNLRREVGDIAALASSIRAQGILQPLLVSPLNGRYQLVAGSRRLAAAKQLGLPTVPAVARQMDAQERLAAMLAENLQRGDLSPIEEAAGYARLLAGNPRIGQRKIAAMVGVSQPIITKRLGLLDFSGAVQDAIHQRRLPIRIAEELHRLIVAGLDKRAEILALRVCSGELLVSEKRMRRTVNDEMRAAGRAITYEANRRALRQQGEEVGPTATEAADAADQLAADERLRALARQGLRPCPTCHGSGAVPLRTDEWTEP